jgi:glycosyltransferase involved in cell wall biosynthesis
MHKTKHTSEPPLVSVIINNYNYGRFIGEAIDSVLRQTYDRVELVVVDDGSTDHSGEVIAGYGERLLPVFKENGGQGSAFNAGFAGSSGDIIIFLDSDDALLPHIVERVVAAFQANPDAANVRYRLEMMDAHGVPLGAVKPSWHIKMLEGDLRGLVLGNADAFWQATSGNAFAARVLKQVLPMPEESYRVAADDYIQKLPLLFGDVISLEEVGGYYRVHGSNDHQLTGANFHRTRTIIRRTLTTDHYIRHYAALLGLDSGSQNLGRLASVRFLALRLASLKLDPAQHPINGDSILRLGWDGVAVSLRRIDLPFHARVICGCWFMAMMFAPKPVAEWLVAKFFHPETRPGFTNLLSAFSQFRFGSAHVRRIGQEEGGNHA